MKSNKSNNKKQTKGLCSRPELLSTESNNTSAPAPAAQPEKVLPYVNYKQRDENRALATDDVLAFIRQRIPQVLPLAEVIGKWVWVTFPQQPEPETRAHLSQIGFHWNNARKCWQHPCGQFATEGSSTDPRVKYGSQMASAARTAAA